MNAFASVGKSDAAEIELTVLMPCLNEAETIAICISQGAALILQAAGIAGEILIADNGSTDGSQKIATDLGARVVPVAQKGYGAALRGGIEAARGRFIIMGDADDSYDFGSLDPFVARLRAGADLVMGNRFQGGIAAGAMPPLHRYLGNPALSFIGRLFFRLQAGDFHCGLRGFNAQSIRALDLRTTGTPGRSHQPRQALPNQVGRAAVRGWRTARRYGSRGHRRRGEKGCAAGGLGIGGGVVEGTCTGLLRLTRVSFILEPALVVGP